MSESEMEAKKIDADDPRVMQRVRQIMDLLKGLREFGFVVKISNGKKGYKIDIKSI